MPLTKRLPILEKNSSVVVRSPTAGKVCRHTWFVWPLLWAQALEAQQPHAYLVHRLGRAEALSKHAMLQMAIKPDTQIYSAWDPVNQTAAGRIVQVLVNSRCQGIVGGRDGSILNPQPMANRPPSRGLSKLRHPPNQLPANDCHKVSVTYQYAQLAWDCMSLHGIAFYNMFCSDLYVQIYIS